MASILGKGKQPKQPTPEELSRLDTEAEVKVSEATSADFPLTQLREFATMVLEDGQYSRYFEPYLGVREDGSFVDNPLYCEAYEPLRLSFSRLLRLGSMTEELERRRFVSSIHGLAMRCHTLVTHGPHARQQHFVIYSMEKYLCTIVPSQTKEGFFFRTLTENRKTLRFLNQPEKKKGILGI